MKLWLTKQLALNLSAQLYRKYPHETGGVLMGYVSSYDYVITHLIDAGPNAIHAPFWFTPDHEYQCSKIEKHFISTGGRETYIGDWHSHPKSRAYLSPQDKKTLKGIAEFPEALIPNPIMIILGTSPFELKCWCYVNMQFKRVKVQLFDSGTG